MGHCFILLVYTREGGEYRALTGLVQQGRVEGATHVARAGVYLLCLFLSHPMRGGGGEGGGGAFGPNTL